MSNPLLRALDRAVSAISAPANSAAPPRAPHPTAPAGAPILASGPQPTAASRVTPLPREALAGVPFASPATKAAVYAKACAGGFVTPAERRAVEACHAPWMRCSDALTELLAHTPAQRRLAHMQSYSARVSSGDASYVGEDGWSLADWEQDQAEKLSALKREMRTFELQAWTVVRPIYLRAADAVDAFVDKMEQAERATAAEFALPHAPSHVVMRLRKVAWELRNTDRSTVGAPLAQLDGLPL